ncbi:MAG: hypothetical protein GY774_04955 [Planctomycetes bacterium]|nr:hypothetical protein [Planctomycetota bacterium]
MSEVRISDIYNPRVFDAAVQERAIELNAFLASGVMVSSSEITALANGPGTIGDLPFFNSLDNPQADGTNEPGYTSDDPATLSTPAKIGSDKMMYRKAFFHRSWSTMDLARQIALQDPIGAITNRIGKYWAVNTELRLIRSCLGLLADNIANDSSDMLFSVYSDIASPTSANLISSDAVIATKSTMGDHAGSLVAIAMHSVLYSELQRQEVIEYERPAGTDIKIPYYLGYRVVVDDSMPVEAGSNSLKYTSVLFSAGSVAIGEGTAAVPSEMERIPGAGNGGGQDIIHSRGVNIIHPDGFSFTSSSVAAVSANYAELGAAANWDRVYAERKNIGIAFLQTNG